MRAVRRLVAAADVRGDVARLERLRSVEADEAALVDLSRQRAEPLA